MVVLDFGEILFEESKEFLGTTGTLFRGRGCLDCRSGDSGFLGVVCLELSSEVGWEGGRFGGRWQCEFLHGSDVCIFSLMGARK
jgi:hypothetical protein